MEFYSRKQGRKFFSRVDLFDVSYISLWWYFSPFTFHSSLEFFWPFCPDTISHQDDLLFSFLIVYISDIFFYFDFFFSSKFSSIDISFFRSFRRIYYVDVEYPQSLEDLPFSSFSIVHLLDHDGLTRPPHETHWFHFREFTSSR